MTVLHRSIYPASGPYIEFYMGNQPLFHPHEPDRRRGASYELFYELGEDLLGAMCSITGQYSPFSPWADTYYVPDLETFKARAKDENLKVQRLGGTEIERPCYGHLQELHHALAEWRGLFQRVDESAIIRAMSYAYESMPPTTQLRADLVETMEFLLVKIERATDQSKTISLIGY